MPSRSRRQEERAARRMGGRPTPGSGNGWLHKNDVRTPTVSVELKYTDKKQYTLKLDDLLTAERNALLDSGRESLFILEMGGREWVICPREYFEGVVARGDSEQSDSS